MATKRDYYDVLGVDKSATTAQIKSAYRKKALEFHPDRNKAADAETKFKEVNEAYEILSNDDKRKTYDQFGHAGFSATGGPASGWNNPFTYTYTTNSNGVNFEDIFGGGNGGFSDPFDIFESFFGNAGFRQSRQQKPHYSLKIDFMEAVNGVEKTIVHQGKQYTIKIPAGADTGTRIRFQDFDVSLDVRPHAQFRRDNTDVYLDHEIPFTTAILGGETTIPTLEGKDLKLKIRSGTQMGSIIRLGGQGVKSLHNNHRGDFYVHLIVKIPTKLSHRQKELLEEFQRT